MMCRSSLPTNHPVGADVRALFAVNCSSMIKLRMWEPHG
jgi:hypothetical protein